MRKVFWCGMLAYVGLAMLPMQTLWYKPGALVVYDAVEGTAPMIEYWRHIKRPAIIEFNVSVRAVGESAPLCEGGGGGYEYQPAEGFVANRDLVWWSGGSDCTAHLPPGQYWAQTCWRALYPARSLLPESMHDLLGWLLPPKSVCSPPASAWSMGGHSFAVTAAEDGESGP